MIFECILLFLLSFFFYSKFTHRFSSCFLFFLPLIHTHCFSLILHFFIYIYTTVHTSLSLTDVAIPFPSFISPTPSTPPYFFFLISISFFFCIHFFFILRFLFFVCTRATCFIRSNQEKLPAMYQKMKPHWNKEFR